MSNLDKTAQIRAGIRGQTSQEQLRDLAQTAQQTLKLARVQQDMLRQRGMNLPPGVIDRLNSIEMGLQALVAQFAGVQIELRQLRALADMTAIINSTLAVDEVLNQVIDTVIALTGAERGFIMLKNEESELEFRVAREIDRESLQSSEFLVSSTIINEVVRTGEAVLTDNAGTDPRYQEQKSILRGAFRSILAVPLRVGDTTTGVVYCDNRIMSGLFKDYELNLLRAFADQAAVALENARLFEATRAQFAEIARVRDVMSNVFASIASGVITLDLDERITSFNSAAERITGRTAEEVDRMSLWEALPNPNADFSELLHQVQEKQTSERYETRINVPGIGEREWQVIMTPLRDGDGKVQGVVIVLDDLTEARQREEQIKAVRRYLPLALAENIRSADLTAIGGQEREITVIFADVRGFTTFSEQLEPEALMQIINRYLSTASDAIDHYEGVIDKYIGDAVTGLFNTPLNPQTDHAQRAVQAAIRIIRDVIALHEQLPEEHRLFYGVGIHTGLAVLGNVGSAERREFTAIGEAVDMSKLLQENASKGEILISEATHALVSDQFEFESLTPTKTGDHSDFKVMYRVLGEKQSEPKPET